MKRLVILAAISLVAVSCGLLGIMPTTGYSATSDPAYNAVQGLAQVLSPGNPALGGHRFLEATEDRGTGLYGYLNEYGLWAIAPTYDYAYNFNEDLGLAVVRLKGGRCGAIDATGRVVIACNFESTYDVESAMRSISKGRYLGVDLWVMQDRATELYGFLDYYGNWFIPPKYLYAASMSSDGYAVVKVEESKWGVIDRADRMIVQPNFTSRYDAEAALKALLRR